MDILRAMERDSGRSLTALKVDGGAAANNLLMQAQVQQTWREERRFRPTADRRAIEAHIARWDAAVAKC